MNVFLCVVIVLIMYGKCENMNNDIFYYKHTSEVICNENVTKVYGIYSFI